ncbi:MATH domain-containing protein-like isoform X1 [Iris pallida]|uniref:MATH domain-containing protein-like isoform X1 n=1 Tax=Iris pallida TaxID=29817 RepID=A0AAX6DPT9_IRIPA|nr:MATH domain-containing protein-like isoform X1 [Iris pallida]
MTELSLSCFITANSLKKPLLPSTFLPSSISNFGNSTRKNSTTTAKSRGHLQGLNRARGASTTSKIASTLVLVNSSNCSSWVQFEHLTLFF